VACKWWRLVHHPRSPIYNGRHSVLGYECTHPLLCINNVFDEQMGGCALKGEGEFTRRGEVKLAVVQRGS